MYKNRISVYLLCLSVLCFACSDNQQFRQQFRQPAPDGGTVTLYWLNGALTKDSVRQQIELLHQNGFKGISPLPLANIKP
ncbi:MAG: hypothetical protein LBT83_00150, partial [Tannerella sp.]|nr:hypothetical protein [Tannerella sp.]